MLQPGTGHLTGRATSATPFSNWKHQVLTVSDYFTPFNQQTLDGLDLDVASGGIILLPDSAGTVQHPHIMMGCCKNGTVYVLDRDSLGHFNSAGDTQIIQEILNLVGGTPWNGTSYVFNCHATPAYWQGNVYLGGVRDAIKMFTFSNGQISTSAALQTATTYSNPGVSPVISANGSSNGIPWAIENTGTMGTDRAGTAVLHAYDARNPVNESYNSAQVASDNVGGYVKFSIPTVVNGKVYVGSQSSVTVYGLISSVPRLPLRSSVRREARMPRHSRLPSAIRFPPRRLPSTTPPMAACPPPLQPFTVDRLASALTRCLGPLGLLRVPGKPGDQRDLHHHRKYEPFIRSGWLRYPANNQFLSGVHFPTALTAGNLSIVAVGWNDTTSTVSGISDSRGTAMPCRWGRQAGRDCASPFTTPRTSSEAATR